jgi:hypothetical protein
VGVTLLLVALSAVLLWVPWFPLDPGAECGWTCYVPLADGQPATKILTVPGRDGHSAALLGSLLPLVAAVALLGGAVARDRLPRFAPVAVVALGVAAAVGVGAAIARILRQDVILVSTGPRDSSQVAAPTIGLGAALAIAVVVATLALGAASAVGARRRPPVPHPDRS